MTLRRPEFQEHEEYGLNPTVMVCLYCGQDTGCIALMGNSMTGRAPARAVLSLKRCKKCEKEYRNAVMFVEMVEDGGQLRPTGRWAALSKEWPGLKDVDDPRIKEMIRTEYVLVDPEVFQMLFEGKGAGTNKDA